jgi:hypothetical protein
MMNRLILGVVQLRVILGPEDERAPSTVFFAILQFNKCLLLFNEKMPKYPK